MTSRFYDVKVLPLVHCFGMVRGAEGVVREVWRCRRLPVVRAELSMSAGRGERRFGGERDLWDLLRCPTSR